MKKVNLNTRLILSPDKLYEKLEQNIFNILKKKNRR